MWGGLRADLLLVWPAAHTPVCSEEWVFRNFSFRTGTGWADLVELAPSRASFPMWPADHSCPLCPTGPGCAGRRERGQVKVQAACAAPNQGGCGHSGRPRLTGKGSSGPVGTLVLPCPRQDALVPWVLPVLWSPLQHGPGVPAGTPGPCWPLSLLALLAHGRFAFRAIVEILEAEKMHLLHRFPDVTSPIKSIKAFNEIPTQSCSVNGCGI